MDIRFSAKNVEVPAQLRDYMEKKLSKIEKFFSRISSCQIVVKMVRNTYITEVTADVNGVILRGEEKDLDLRKSYDIALKNLERRIRRHKEYLVSRGRLKTPDFTFETEMEPEHEEDHKIVKEKHFDLTPMTPHEAVMQMDLLEHSFFVFLNADNGKINVVYTRSDGNYGIIMPN